MSMIRWEPFREVLNLRQAMDKFMEDGLRYPGVFTEGTMPSVDIFETDNDFVVKASVPGVKQEDLDISIVGATLTIKGEIKAEEEQKGKNYYRQECRYGSFARSLTLPAELNADKAEANMENGILTLTIPKMEKAKPKAIKVKAKEVKELKESKKDNAKS